MKKYVISFVLAGISALVGVSISNVYPTPTAFDSTYETSETDVTLCAGVSTILYSPTLGQKAVPYAGVAFLNAAKIDPVVAEEDVTVEPETQEIVASPIETEEILEEATEVEEIEEPVIEETSSRISMTDEELELLARCVIGESGAEPELARRLTIDTILNRVESDEFPDTVYDVIYQPHAFSAMQGKIVKTLDFDDFPWIWDMIEEELENRTNSEVLYFRMDYYFDWAEPITHSGTTYFSK